MLMDQWICDKCGRSIEKIEDGWLTWMRNLNDDTLSHFKIVHYPSCQQPEPEIRRSRLSEPGDPLIEFQGKNGLIRLLEFIPQVEKENQNQILSVIQRLYIPGYETARFKFDQAAVDGYLVPPIDDLYYLTIEKIEEINEQYN